MTTYRPFNKFDIVELIAETEIAPCFYLVEGVQGVVMDMTVPDYYLIKFEKCGSYWVEGSKLKLYNNKEGE